VKAGHDRGVAIRMVENGPSKDRGDNEDGVSLEKLGILKRRTLNLQRIFKSGIMHSKFIIADNKHFYLGSANSDWRSLNQKMEMGVLVSDCPCLARELVSIFDIYWRTAEAKDSTQMADIVHQSSSPPKFNEQSMLRLRSVEARMFLAVRNLCHL